MTVLSGSEAGRVYFGTLDARSPEARALGAIGEAVPALEKCLGFSVSVSAQAQPEGLIWAEVYVPDEHYTAQNRHSIRAALREAVRPLDVYAEIFPSPEHVE